MLNDEHLIEAARQELERRKCEADFEYFVDNYCMMWSKEGGDPIPFKLWEFQKDACHNMQSELKLIFLKARQLGLSWLAMAYVVWCMLFKKNFHAYVTSVGLREVVEQMERIRFIWYNLPDWLKKDVQLGGKGCKDNDSLIEFSNGSAIHAVASSKAAGHGSAPGLYILDEFSRKEGDVLAWRAIKPSLGAKSQVFIISTSAGFNNLFAELWFGAEKGENGFKPIFYAADVHPNYTPEYLRDMQMDFAGDRQGYLEAFPMSPKDAFMASSRSVFDAELIRIWREADMPPHRVGFLDERDDGTPFFVDDDAGHLVMWREPKPEGRYTMGLDLAEGLVDGDWTVGCILDVDDMEVAALWRMRIPQENAPYPAMLLGRFYNNAFIVPEVNKAADLVLGELKVSYPQLYRRVQRQSIYDSPTLVPGFYSSSTSKPRVILALRKAFSNTVNPLKIYSTVILDEMSVYEQDEKGSLGAQRGKHDDCVMALALAVEGIETIPIDVSKLTSLSAENIRSSMSF